MKIYRDGFWVGLFERGHLHDCHWFERNFLVEHPPQLKKSWAIPLLPLPKISASDLSIELRSFSNQFLSGCLILCLGVVTSLFSLFPVTVFQAIR